ncbi:PorP/SprF family type IX secretion system membrane protein [Aureivirga sp. CE67]|uniref:PorP/SprF family type IX secretion system membrane protein n=1 Tax=Aureivirga sp. CE67 TaxID=1788983 RepID=UPI0018C98685|nr:PorP/SprF family type IX secretion system membrane protein [Aureivirga sp. CE67]
MKKLYLLLLVPFTIYSQETPKYVQYIYNLSSINPGYSINEPGILRVGGIGISENFLNNRSLAKTYNFFAQTSISDKMELNLNYLNREVENIYDSNYSRFNGNLSYLIQLTKKSHLSLGFAFGFNQKIINTTKYTYVDPDPNFKENVNHFNLGSGLMFFTENLFVGVSSLNFLKNEYETFDQKKDIEIYGLLGYVFEIGKKWKLKPMIFTNKMNTKFETNYSVNLLYDNFFELGYSYVDKELTTFLMRFKFKNSKVGCAMEFEKNTIYRDKMNYVVFLTHDFYFSHETKNYEKPRYF